MAIAQNLYVMRIFIILLVFFGFSGTNAQESPIKRGFKASIIGGINLSQLDEDGLVGFSKPGLRGGFVIERNLTINKGISLSVLYEERGSSGKLFGIKENSTIRLNYISIPLSYIFSSWWYAPLKRHKLQFALSMIPSRLIHSFSNHSEFDESVGTFNEWDFSVSIQLSYALGKRGSVQLFINRSLNKSFDSDVGENTLQHYIIGLQIGYSLNKTL